MALSPPGRFSTTTGWPSCSASGAARARAVGSAEPPGGKPTTKRIGLFGYCAAALPANRRSAANSVLIGTPPRRNYTGPITKKGGCMPRIILDESKIHPAVRDRIAGYRVSLINEVQAAIAANDIVVVGMRQNPAPKRARKALDAAGLKYAYLEYGSYFSLWRRRLGLKMWTGWPTFPMIWVKGVLVGGADDLIRLMESGEIRGRSPN